MFLKRGLPLILFLATSNMACESVHGEDNTNPLEKELEYARQAGAIRPGSPLPRYIQNASPECRSAYISKIAEERKFSEQTGMLFRLVVDLLYKYVWQRVSGLLPSDGHLQENAPIFMSQEDAQERSKALQKERAELVNTRDRYKVAVEEVERECGKEKAGKNCVEESQKFITTFDILLFFLDKFLDHSSTDPIKAGQALAEIINGVLKYRELGGLWRGKKCEERGHGTDDLGEQFIEEIHKQTVHLEGGHNIFGEPNPFYIPGRKPSKEGNPFPKGGKSPLIIPWPMPTPVPAIP